MSRLRWLVGLWLLVALVVLNDVSIAAARGQSSRPSSLFEKLGDVFRGHGSTQRPQFASGGAWSWLARLGGILGGRSSGPGPSGDLVYPQPPPTTPVGSLPGQFEVDRRGQATYAVPFEVPPGVNGLQPALGLNYSSARGMGLVGMGFAMSGLSAIARCPKTLTHDGEHRAVQLEQDDALCLDGQRLVWTGGSQYGAAGAEYRTRVESFRKVVTNQTIDDLNSSFTVYTKDGRVLTYGGTTTARLYGPGARPYSWALNRIEDRFGNFVLIEYAQDPYNFSVETNAPNLEGDVDDFRYEGTTGHRPTRIRYTGGPGRSPQREVRFEYIDLPRQQQVEGWRGGVLHVVQHLLSRVIMSGPLGEVRAYELEYDDSSITAQPRLDSLRVCDGTGEAAVCMPATRFAWEAGEEGYADFPQAFDAVDFPATDDGCFTGSKAAQRLVLDADADGAQDFLIARGQDGGVFNPGGGPFDDACNDEFFWHLWFSDAGGHSNGDPTDSPWDGGGFEEYPTGRVANFMSDRPSDTNPYENLTVSVINFNGDHRDDIVYLLNGESSDGTPNSWDLIVLASNPDHPNRYTGLGLSPDGVPAFPITYDGPLAIRQFVTPDLDGNGFHDLMICRGDKDDEVGQWHYLMHDGDASDGSGLSGTGIALDLDCSAKDELLVLDYDGDGAQELLMVPSVVDGIVLDDDERRQYFAVELDFVEQRLADLRPTGLPRDNLQRYDGSSCDPTGGVGRDKIIDFNGDGLQDIVRSEPVNGDRPGTSVCRTQEIVIRIWENVGGRFVAGAEVFGAGPRKYLAKTFAYAVPIDYNADGRVDLLVPRARDDGPTRVETWWEAIVFLPDGFRRQRVFDGVEVPQLNPNFIDEPRYRLQSMVPMGDLDGDGLHDVALHDAHFGRWDLKSHRGRRPDLLTGITNGHGAWMEIEYDAITTKDNADLYEEGGGCTFPQTCYTGPRHVVAAYEEDMANEHGAVRRHQFTYEDGRTRQGGWGWLGFRRVQELEFHLGQISAIREREYDLDTFSSEIQDHPFADIPVREQVQVPLRNAGRQWVKRTLRSPQLRIREGRPLEAGAFGEAVTTYHLPILEDSVTEEFEIDGWCSIALDAITTLCSEEDLGSEFPLRRVQTEQTVDEYGTVVFHRNVYGDGRTTTVVKDRVRHDTDRWLLGLVEHEFTTDTTPTGDTEARNWSARYDEETGALDQYTREPTDDELILDTWYWRDRHGNVFATLARDGWGQMRLGMNVYDDEGVFPVRHYNGLLQESTTRWRRGLGVPFLQTDPNGVSQVMVHDTFGRLVATERLDAQGNREGAQVTYRYERADDAGDSSAPSRLRLWETVAGGSASVTDHDRLGRPIRRTTAGYFGQDLRSETQYDARGFVNVVREIDDDRSEVTRTTFVHDNLGRPIASQTGDGRVTLYQYDGRVTTRIDPEGNLQKTGFDEHGRVVQMTRGSTGFPAHESDVVCYHYAPFGYLDYVRKGCHEAPHPPGSLQTVDLEPDAYGRNLSLWDTALGRRSYVYDGFGNLLEAVDAKLQATQFQYDILGRVVQAQDADGTTRWQYDQSFIGALGRTRSPDGHVNSYDYDEFGRLASTTSVIDGRNYTVSQDYDEFGRLARLEYPRSRTLAANEFALTYGYDGFGNLTTVRNGIAGTVYWRALEADHRNRVTAEEFGNGVYTQRSFHPHKGALSTIRTIDPTGDALQWQHYDYDDNLNLIARSEEIASMRQSETFAYDALDRLTDAEATGPNSSRLVTASYTQSGDIDRRSDRGTYTYDAQGRLERVGNVEFAYDDNGNVTARSIGGLTFDPTQADFTYNAQDKIARIETDDDTLHFEYDADEHRVLRMSEDERSTTYYVGELLEEVVEQGRAWRPQRRYKIHVNGRVVAQVNEETGPGAFAPRRETVYIHDDHLGSANVITDHSGTEIQRMAFDAWGGQRSNDWTSPEPYENPYDIIVGFTGHQERTDADLINMRGRMYDPSLGRFMSPDPFVTRPDSLHGWNRYAYVENNPLVYTDPSGYEAAETKLSDTEGQGVGTQQYIDCPTGEVCTRKITIDGPTPPAWNPQAAYDVFQNFAAWTRTVSESQGAPPTQTSSSAPDAAWWSTAGQVAWELTIASATALSTVDAIDVALLASGGIAAAADGPLPFGDIYLAGVVGNSGRKVLSAIRKGASDAAKAIKKATKGSSGAADDAVHASTPVGRRGAPLNVPSGTNAPATIGGRNFTAHALDQMQSRGFTPSVVENAIQNGVRTTGNDPGTFKHVVEGVRVITNEAGGVITVIPR